MRNKSDKKDFSKKPATREDKYSHDDLVTLEQRIDQTWRDIQQITQICSQYKQKITDQLQGISNINSDESQDLIVSLEKENKIFLDGLYGKLIGTRGKLSILQGHLTTAQKNTQDEKKKEYLETLSGKLISATNQLYIAIPNTETSSHKNDTEIFASAVDNFETELQNATVNIIQKKQSDQDKIDSAMQKKENAKINQSALIDKFIKYMEIQQKAELSEEQKAGLSEEQKAGLSEEQKKKMREGLCFGFSLVHSYMDATDQLPWWENMLKSIAAMEVSENSLGRSISPEGVTTDSWGEQTLGKTLERAAGYVLYHMWATGSHVWEQDEKFSLRQQNLLSPTYQGETIRAFSAMQDGQEKNVSFNATFTGNPTTEMLTQLFDTIKPPGGQRLPGVIMIDNHEHAITARWDQQKNAWFLYDPNNPDREIRFENSAELVSFLQEKYGKSLSIAVSSWEKPQDNPHIQQIGNMLNEFYCTEFKKNGMGSIIKYAPEQLHNLLEQSKDNPQMNNAILDCFKNAPGGKSHPIHLIALFTPMEIPNLLEITKQNFIQRSKVIECLALRYDDQSTVFHHIASNPKILSQLCELAKNNHDLRTQINKLSFEKDNKGITPLQIITEKSPETLLKLQELLKSVKGDWRGSTKDPIKSALNEATNVQSNISGQFITLKQLNDCLKEYKTSSKNLFGNEGPELQALNKLIADNLSNPNKQFTINEVTHAIQGAKSIETTFGGKAKNHRANLLTNPDADEYKFDQTGVSNVIRAIGRKLAESQKQPADIAENKSEAPKIGK